MKLLYFVQYFPPEKASGLPLVMDLLEGFAKAGWDVDVYTPTPTRGVTPEVRKAYKKKTLEVLFDGKVKVHRMPLYNEGKKMLQRTIRYSIFSFQCLLKGLFCPADMIFTGGGPPTQGIVAGLIYKWTKKKVIYNPQDLFPDSLIYSGKATEKSLAVRLWRKIEKFSYDHAHAVITITEEMKKTILTRCDHPERVYVVNNWVDTNAIQPVSRDSNSLFDQFALPKDAFYVTYAGNIGAMQGVEVIVESAKLLKEYPEIRFVIFGNGSEEQKIREFICANSLHNVSLFPLQPAHQVPGVYSLGDMSVVCCKAGTSKAGMPSKIWTILASGTCILASFDKDSELDQILESNQCGVCVEPEDPVCMANTILRLSKEKEYVDKMGANGLQYARNHCGKDANVASYISIMDNIC